MATKNLEAKLRIEADFAQAVQALKNLKNQVMLVKKESADAAPGAEPFASTRRSITSINEQLGQARRQLAGFVAGLAAVAGARQVLALADAYAGMNARLRLATKSQEEFNEAQATSIALARQYQAPLSETATLFTRILGAVRPLGGGLLEARVTTEALLASLKLTGATTAEAASAILQFSQALGSGVLRGEEFNALAEAAPSLLDALARGLGKPREELKRLAEEGRLTTSAVVGALRVALPQLQRDAAQLPSTVAGAVQRLRDAWLQLVGAQAEGSAAIAGVVAVLRGLADNLQTIVGLLTALTLLWGSIKVGAFVAGVAAAASGMATAATITGTLTIAMRGLLAVVGGPVGLVVTLTALAAAWLAVDSAKKKAGLRSADVVTAERDAAQAELDRLRDERRKQGAFVAPGVNFAQQEQLEKLKRLNRELSAIERQREDDLRASGGPRGGPALAPDSALRDPRSIQDFEKQYEDRSKIARRFADERAAYERAKDTDIARARAAGDVELERRLVQEKVAALATQKKAENDALRKLDADSTLSRLATYKDQYDRLAELAADANTRQLELNQSLFDQNLRSAQDYFRERERLEDDAAKATIAKLQKELEDRRKVLATNRQVLARAGNANDRAAAVDGVTQAQSDVARTEVELARAQRDAVDKTRQRLLDERGITKELRDQTAEIDRQLKTAQGTFTLADKRAELEARFAKQREQEFVETGDTAQTDAQIASELRQFEFARTRELFAQATDDLRLKEQALEDQVAKGSLTAVEAESKKLELRRQELDGIDKVAKRMAELARTPDEKREAAGASRQVNGLRASNLEADLASAQDLLRNSAKGGLQQTLTDITTGAKTAKEALVDMVGGFAGAMLNVLNKRLAEALVGQFETAFKGSTGQSFFSKAADLVVNLFHSGGVVGQGGTSRAVPGAALAGMASWAPRYHSGGIAGLRPREVPAILEAGEEVLTTDDPRHVRNGGTAGGSPVIGNFSVNVRVEPGADGGSATSAMAEGLSRVLRIKVEEGIREQMRPGGLLATR